MNSKTGHQVKYRILNDMSSNCKAPSGKYIFTNLHDVCILVHAGMVYIL